MIEAPVGFHCPECVREASKLVRPGRTLAGGAIHRNPTFITKILVVANVGLYALQYLSNDRLTNDYAMNGVAVALGGEWWRLITSAFLHASPTHLLLNMLALWIVGGIVEPRLGRWRYLTVYLVSALAGSVLSYLADPVSQTSVGASGAVFGLFGALFVLVMKLRLDVRGVVALIVINVVIGFVPAFGINWRAHLGGLIAGTILTAVMVYAPQRSRLWMSIGTSALVVLLCLVGTVARTEQIDSCLQEQQEFEPCNTGIWGPR
jgi:membrane associated rhomboid family serine protease